MVSIRGGSTPRSKQEAPVGLDNLSPRHPLRELGPSNLIEHQGIRGKMVDHRPQSALTTPMHVMYHSFAFVAASATRSALTALSAKSANASFQVRDVAQSTTEPGELVPNSALGLP